MNNKQRWLWNEELGNWRMAEFIHQMDMDAKENLPAGSMLDISDDCGYESYCVFSEFNREERK